MSDALRLVRRQVLYPAGLSDNDLQRAFTQLANAGMDDGDLYFQHHRQESWSLEDGIVRNANHTISQGVGVRAIHGEKTGLAYSDELAPQALIDAAAAARSISRANQMARTAVPATISATQEINHATAAIYPSTDPIDSLDAAAKVALLTAVDTEARKLDPRIKQVMVSLSGSHDALLIARINGDLHADIRPLIRLNITVVAEQNGRREQGTAGGGARSSYYYLRENNRHLEMAHEAVHQALVNLDARDAPAGAMTVVLGAGWPGVLLHEAVGHGLEGDFIRKGTSAYTGRVGEQVASEHCTVVDDGTLANRRGSLSIDDEGTPTQQTILIENGILKGFMHDRMSARLMNKNPSGNGRRQSYAHMTLPRMTNTFMRAGDYHPEEVIGSVEKGLYAVNFSGGSVDITNGRFVFSASEAYLIENGKIGAPVKGATLTGNGPEVMRKVSMVGNDLQLDTGIGTCGKEGQGVPVGVGQPTLRIDELTVGGTRTDT